MLLARASTAEDAEDRRGMHTDTVPAPNRVQSTPKALSSCFLLQGWVFLCAPLRPLRFNALAKNFAAVP